MGIRDRKPFLIVGCTVAAFGIGAVLLRAISKVQVGHGLDTYRTAKGALVSYSSFVVICVVLVLCVAAAYGARWWHFRQQRKFDEILRARDKAANTPSGKSAGTGS